MVTRKLDPAEQARMLATSKPKGITTSEKFAQTLAVFVTRSRTNEIICVCLGQVDVIRRHRLDESRALGYVEVRLRDFVRLTTRLIFSYRSKFVAVNVAVGRSPR